MNNPDRVQKATLVRSAVSSHIFGPVPSRRLGRSLGVDLVPFKTCSYDCIYCQLGRTTCKTTERKEWAPLEPVLVELKDKLATRPDYITLSGSGEPTLFSRVGELIARIKDMTDIPLAVLTNGSLLWRQDVRDQLMQADLVIPSLDAGDEATFQAVNRPHEDITFESVLPGLVAFREEFRGQYWLEVMLLAGHTAMEASVKALAECARRIRPDRIQLNTVTRPPCEDFARGVRSDRLAELAKMFDPPAELIADFHGMCEPGEFAAGQREILEMLARRPCSIEDIAAGLGMHRNEVVKYVKDLADRGLAELSLAGGTVYYNTR